MDEEAWLTATDPLPMLDWLRQRGELSDRKARLFACASVRRIWPLLADERSRQAVEVAERFADGLATGEELALACDIAYDAYIDTGTDAAATAAYNLTRTAPITLPSGHKLPFDSTVDAVILVVRAVGSGHEELSQQACLLRCIVPNPFAPPPHLDPAWLQWQDATVLRMAKGIYEERAFDRMRVLADALLDAGCDDEAMLAHCREQGCVHAKGCWVIDLLLGKS
jgi:hypothetical protein